MLSRRGGTCAPPWPSVATKWALWKQTCTVPWARAIGAESAAFDATLPNRRGSPQLGMLLHQIPRRLTLLEERWHNPPVEHIFHKCVAPAQVTFLVLAFANAFDCGLIASRARSVVRNKRAISAFNRWMKPPDQRRTSHRCDTRRAELPGAVRQYCHTTLQRRERAVLANNGRRRALHTRLQGGQRPRLICASASAARGSRASSGNGYTELTLISHST
jgi:hypothetical protein